MAMIDAAGPTRAARPRPDTLAFGGWLSAAGALSVVVTGLFYIASPQAAAGPVRPLDVAAAMAGAISGAQTLRAAGTLGIFGDIGWAIATLVVAAELSRRDRGVAAAGWLGLFLSILLFTFVDGLTGFVLTPLAATGDAAAFEGFKRLWDLLFLLGTATYGAGAVLALGGDLASARPMVSRPLAWAALAVAVMGMVAAGAGFAGLSADKFAGASILLGPLLFIPISLQVAKAGAKA